MWLYTNQDHSMDLLTLFFGIYITPLFSTTSKNEVSNSKGLCHKTILVAKKGIWAVLSLPSLCLVLCRYYVIYATRLCELPGKNITPAKHIGRMCM